MPQYRRQADGLIRSIRNVLKGYNKDHPQAEITVYRYNSASIRVRIIDPDFHGMGRADRDAAVWTILEKLPEEVISEITLLLLLTPEETKTSFANMEFDHPVPSRL